MKITKIAAGTTRLGTPRSASDRALPTAAITAIATAAAILLAPALLAAQPVPTEVVVRAVAHDAKLVGTGVGGARITIRDVETDEVLAQGVQEGGTGSTDLIMREPRERGETVFDTPGAAGYRATLDLERSTVVEITALGPLGTPHARQRASRTLLLLPGEDVTGEGIVLTLHGFKVELREPEEVALPDAGDALAVQARVEMMCGCPITPGGLWDANRTQVRAALIRDGTRVAETKLEYAGEASIFRGELRPPSEAGPYELVVTAADPERANFGMARRTILLDGS